MVKNCSHIIYSGLGGHTDYVLTLCESKYLKNTIHFYGVEPVPDLSKKKIAPVANGYTETLKKPGFDFKSTKELIRKLKTDPNKVIITHQPNLIIWLWLFNFFKRKKYILVEHQNNQLKTKREWVWSLLSQILISHRVYLTEEYKSEVKKKLGVFFRNRNSSIIRTSVQKEWFQEKQFDRRNTKLVFGMQSRLVAIKDHVTLIKAFAEHLKKHPDHQLKIAGDGDTKNELESLVANLKIEQSVHFEGMLTQSKLRDFLYSLDVYIHATYGETLSIAVMQAQACPLPIIASKVKGIENFLNPSDTLLVELKSIDDLKKAMEQMLDVNIRERMMENSRINSVSLKSDKMAKEFTKLIF